MAGPPTTDLEAAYIDALIGQVRGGNTDATLLDRIELALSMRRNRTEPPATEEPEGVAPIDTEAAEPPRRQAGGLGASDGPSPNGGKGAPSISEASPPGRNDPTPLASEDTSHNAMAAEDMDVLDAYLDGHSLNRTTMNAFGWDGTPIPDRTPAEVAEHVYAKLWDAPRQAGQPLEEFTAWFVGRGTWPAPKEVDWLRDHPHLTPLPQLPGPAPLRKGEKRASVSEAVLAVLQERPSVAMGPISITSEVSRRLGQPIEVALVRTILHMPPERWEQRVRKVARGLYAYLERDATSEAVA